MDRSPRRPLSNRARTQLATDFRGSCRTAGTSSISLPMLEPPTRSGWALSTTRRVRARSSSKPNRTRSTRWGTCSIYAVAPSWLSPLMCAAWRPPGIRGRSRNKFRRPCSRPALVTIRHQPPGCSFIRRPVAMDSLPASVGGIEAASRLTRLTLRRVGLSTFSFLRIEPGSSRASWNETVTTCGFTISRASRQNPVHVRSGAEPYAIWSRDGRNIIWRNGPGALYRKASNFTGTEELLSADPGQSPSSLSPDDKTLLVVKGGVDIWTLPLAPEPSGNPPRRNPS